MYQHLNNDGCVRSGKCKSIPEVLKMTGHFSLLRAGNGIQEIPGSSVIEEI